MKFILVLEFVINIHHFSLYAELIILPLLIIISLLVAIGGTDPKFKPVENVLTTILTIIGLSLLVLSIIDIINSIKQYANFDTLKAILLPLILSVAFIPFAYLIGLYINYELLFTRFKIFLDDIKLRRYAQRRAFYRCGFNLGKIKNLTPIIMKEFYSGINRNEIKTILKN